MRHDRSQDVEWGYAFDIHLNAFFPPLIILHMLQLFLYPSKFIKTSLVNSYAKFNYFFIISNYGEFMLTQVSSITTLFLRVSLGTHFGLCPLLITSILRFLVMLVGISII